MSSLLIWRAKKTFHSLRSLVKGICHCFNKLLGVKTLQNQQMRKSLFIGIVRTSKNRSSLWNILILTKNKLKLDVGWLGKRMGQIADLKFTSSYDNDKKVLKSSIIAMKAESTRLTIVTPATVSILLLKGVRKWGKASAYAQMLTDILILIISKVSKQSNFALLVQSPQNMLFSAVHAWIHLILRSAHISVNRRISSGNFIFDENFVHLKCLV